MLALLLVPISGGWILEHNRRMPSDNFHVSDDNILGLSYRLSTMAICKGRLSSISKLEIIVVHQWVCHMCGRNMVVAFFEF